MVRTTDSFTSYGWTVCLWVLVVSFQYGYNTAALNQIHAVLTCKDTGVGTAGFRYELPTCIPMSDAAFSFVTSVFTIGGLLGSMFANIIMDKWGRRGAAHASAVTTSLGAGLMGISSSLTSLSIGRLLAGIGGGFGICLAPIYISEIAPETIRNRVGILTQVSIVTAQLVTQIIGLNLATPTQWRFVLFVSSAIAIAQLLLSPIIVESPVWLGRQGFQERRKLAARRLWGNEFPSRLDSSGSDVDDPLLAASDEDRCESHIANVTVPQLLVAAEFRRPLMIVSLAMFAQQLSGINAVIYYSNAILIKALPKRGPYISVAVAVVNFVMAFPPIFLVDRIGRKSLFQVSVAGAFLSLLAMGFGLDTGFVALTSTAILTFVMSFAIGLGPVPFILIPEVSSPHAASALSSVALSMNWIANFIVGQIFLPLRDLFSSGDPLKEGRVFYLIAVILCMASYALSRVYRG